MSDIMEELLYFYNTYKIKFEIGLKMNNIYIRFNTGVMLAASILNNSNDIILMSLYNIR